MPSKILSVPRTVAKRSRMLSKRQIKLVKKITRAGLKPVMYKRGKNAKGYSVHNPFLDAKRRAKAPKSRMQANKQPQAYDTKAQRKFSTAKRTVNKNINMRLKKKKGFLDSLFNP